MGLSSRILDLLNVLDYPEARVEYLREHFQDMVREEPLFTSEQEAGEHGAIRDMIRKLTSALVKEKIEPTRGSTEGSLSQLFEDSPDLRDDLLDAYFTTIELQGIPGIVGRWKNLRALELVLLPGKKVRRYLRQASTCYLYGLPEATAILCRAVLQFALEEALALPGGVSLNPSELRRKDSLENLIDSARLPHALAAKAHSIRKLGNKSVHESGCSESDALGSIRDAGEVLSHLYGRTPMSG